MNKSEWQRMDATSYPDHWASESRVNEDQGIYGALANITPSQRTLEVGCGTGLGTVALARTRPVLAIDNNPKLIARARQTVRDAGLDAEILHDDLFTLTESTANAIANFAPDGIVCWFMGSHPYDVDRHTSPDVPVNMRPKQYRENIEDRVTRPPLCGDAVQWIHLANRVAVATVASVSDIVEATTHDYNTYMLGDVPFQVADVQVLDWTPGEFAYVLANNPAFMGGEIEYKVVSVLIRRV